MELIEELECYTGEAWAVDVVLYEDEEPWLEEGTVASWIYDDEEEAKDKYCELVHLGYVALSVMYVDDGETDAFDRLGVFLRETSCENGISADRYYTDEIVDSKIWEFV